LWPETYLAWANWPKRYNISAANVSNSDVEFNPSYRHRTSKRNISSYRSDHQKKGLNEEF